MPEEQIEENKSKEILGGPKTEEGKQASRFNALTHGILRESLTEYEEGLYEAILSKVIEDLTPENTIEKILAERVAICYLKLFRIGRAEKEFLLERLRPEKSRMVTIRKSELNLMPYLGEDKVEKEIIQQGYEALIKYNDVEKLTSTYSRYETTYVNELYKSLHEYERLKRLKNGEKIPPPISVDIGIENQS